jgi:hypothetical protein
MFSVPYDPGAAKERTWQASVDGRLFASKTIFLLLSLPGENPAIHLAGFRRRSLMPTGYGKFQQPILPGRCVGTKPANLVRAWCGRVERLPGYIPTPGLPVSA